jgi:hypothetical protein
LYGTSPSRRNRDRPTLRTRSLGEKGIGILSFQALAEVCQIYTRHQDANQTYCLELGRGRPQATIRAVDRGNLLEIPGTEVHLVDVAEQTFRVLGLPKLVEYFRDRWRQALAADEFTLTMTQGSRHERVRPGRFEGELFLRRARTELGYVEFELYLSPRTQQSRRVAVVGVGGAQILRDLAADPEFARPPWDSDQVQGEIRFPALKQTTGRRGVQRDHKVFPRFVAAVESIEPELSRQIEALNREQDRAVDTRLTRAIRQAFRKALAEIKAMSTTGLTITIADPAGDEAEGSLFDEAAAGADGRRAEVAPDESAPPEPTPDALPDGERGEGQGEGGDAPSRSTVEGTRDRTRQSPASALNYRPAAFEDSRLHSRYNASLRLLEVNTVHPDYRRARERDRRTFLDYLVVVVAKELTLLNYQGIEPGELMERYAELLAGVQLHLPKRI